MVRNDTPSIKSIRAERASSASTPVTSICLGAATLLHVSPPSMVRKIAPPWPTIQQTNTDGADPAVIAYPVSGSCSDQVAPPSMECSTRPGARSRQRTESSGVAITLTTFDTALAAAMEAVVPLAFASTVWVRRLSAISAVGASALFLGVSRKVSRSPGSAGTTWSSADASSCERPVSTSASKSSWFSWSSWFSVRSRFSRSSSATSCRSRRSSWGLWALLSTVSLAAAPTVSVWASAARCAWQRATLRSALPRVGAHPGRETGPRTLRASLHQDSLCPVPADSSVHRPMPSRSWRRVARVGYRSRVDSPHSQQNNCCGCHRRKPPPVNQPPESRGLRLGGVDSRCPGFAMSRSASLGVGECREMRLAAGARCAVRFSRVGAHPGRETGLCPRTLRASLHRRWRQGAPGGRAARLPPPRPGATVSMAHARERGE